jgi:hypothetical protein
MRIIEAVIVTVLAANAHAKAVPASSATKAQKILKQKIPAYYENTKGPDMGVVTELGRAKLTATQNPNILKAVVHFDGNQLWGGDNHYRVTVDVNLKTGLIKPLNQPVITKVIN